MAESMDRVFRALADPHRRTMLDLIKVNSGCNVAALCEHFSMSRIGAMKHLRILEEAGLVLSKRNGRERNLYLNVMPLQLIYERWTTEFSSMWATPLARLKQELEAAPSKTNKSKRKKKNG